MINLKEKHLQILLEIFEGYCPKAEIWAYGSRVHGDSHSGSDLDLVVKSFNDESKKLWELRELCRESNIPFLIDLHAYDELPQSFQQEILKNYVVIFPAKMESLSDAKLTQIKSF